MDEQTFKKLTRFISQANVGHLHPSDERRFYDFMLSAFKQWEAFDHDMVRRILIESGFSEEKAIELVALCEHAKYFLDYIKEKGQGLLSI